MITNIFNYLEIMAIEIITLYGINFYDTFLDFIFYILNLILVEYFDTIGHTIA